VGDLEERSDAEGLGKICAETREAHVVKENISLDLLGNVLHGARIGKPQSFSSL
jgi:hypothetical protein